MKGHGPAILLASLIGAMLLLTGLFQPPAPEKVRIAPLKNVGEGIVQSEETLLIDLNAADERLLAALPGIGEVLAARIAAYRCEHGPFQTVDELLNVPGIGEGKLDAMLERITIQ